MMVSEERGTVKTLTKSLIDMEARFGVIDRRDDNCTIHGAFISRLTVHKDEQRWQSCPQCAAEATTRQELAELAVARQNRTDDAVEALMGRSAIPKKYRDKSFDGFVFSADEAIASAQRRVVRYCERYADTYPDRVKEGRCLVLLGPPGTGKTHMANAIAKRVIEKHGMSALYTTASEMVRTFKDNFTTHEHTESHLIRLFSRPKLLILDEIGIGWGSATELNYLFEVINARNLDGLPTILAGNLAKVDVRKELGDRVADRLNEGGGGDPLLFVWGSHRMMC